MVKETGVKGNIIYINMALWSTASLVWVKAYYDHSGVSCILLTYTMRPPYGQKVCYADITGPYSV